MKINTYIKSTQYTVVSNTFVQRLFQELWVCTQNSSQEKWVHTTNLANLQFLSVFARGVYCVLLHGYLYTKKKCYFDIDIQMDK